MVNLILGSSIVPGVTLHNAHERRIELYLAKVMLTHDQSECTVISIIDGHVKIINRVTIYEYISYYRPDMWHIL